MMFIIKLLSQHVSSIIMPIIRRTRLCTIAYGVLHCKKRGKKPLDVRAVVSLCGVMSSKHSWDFVCIYVCHGVWLVSNSYVRSDVLGVGVVMRVAPTCWKVCGVRVISCFQGGGVWVMGGVSTGCVSIEGVVI